jgi:hypothetical protein
MSLSDPVLTGPGAGRTVSRGHGSSAELKIAGEESGWDWAVVEWRVRAGDAALPKDVPHVPSVRGEEARLLVTLAPAGTEYFLVPRDENDADPARFGLILQGPAMAA